MKKTTSQFLLSAAVAGLIGAGAGLSSSAQAKDKKCYGANSCKGTSACKTANNACKGQNACKGTGVSMMSKADCKAANGSFKAPKAAPKADAAPAAKEAGAEKAAK